MQVDSSLIITNDSLVLADTTNFSEPIPVSSKPSSFITESTVPKLESNTLEKHTGDWITALLILGFVLLAALNFLFRKRFRDLFKAFWARNYSNQLIREGNIFKEQFGLGLFILYIISIPLFYAFSVTYLLPKYESTLSILLIIQLALLPLIVWIFKVLFVKTTALIFDTSRSSNEVLTQLFIFNMVSGVAVLPFSALFYYSELDIFLIMGLVIWSFIQIYRFVRLFVVGFSFAIFSGLHLFLYLCTLEIIPIVILLKILSNIYQ